MHRQSTIKGNAILLPSALCNVICYRSIYTHAYATLTCSKPFSFFGHKYVTVRMRMCV